MKKKEFVRHLESQECFLLRQGKHEVWMNPSNGTTAAVPRHTTMIGSS